MCILNQSKPLACTLQVGPHEGKLYKKGLKMALMNRFNARSVATLGAGKYNDGAGLLLHKRKDGGAQWFYRYTIHDRRREMEVGAL